MNQTNQMQILDIRWFCGSSNVGIVQVEFDDGIGYYIGSPPVIRTENEDAQWIADWGSTFPKDAGDVLFNRDSLRNGSAVQIPMNKEQAELMIRVGNLFLDQKVK